MPGPAPVRNLPSGAGPVSRSAPTTGCPAASDAVLIASELAANAVTSASGNGGEFTLRAEVRERYVWVEVEDAGGSWTLIPHDDGRPHGLDVIEAIAGPGNWGVDGDASGRIVWAMIKTGLLDSN